MMKSGVPIIQYEDICSRLNEFFPPPPVFFLRSRGERGKPKLIPTNEKLLVEDASFLRLWLTQLLGEGKKALSLEWMEPETSSTSWGDFPSFSALARQLQAVGDPLKHLPEPWQSEEDLLAAVVRELNGSVRALVGRADRLLALFKKLRMKIGRKEMGKLPLEYILLSGVPEIPTIFAPLLKNLFPQAQIKEFYAAAEGIFGMQADKRIGLSLFNDRYFFQVETKKGIKPLTELGRKEMGSLIVTTPLLPNYRIGDLIMSLGGNRYRILHKEGNYPISSFYLHDISYEGGLP